MTRAFTSIALAAALAVTAMPAAADFYKRDAEAICRKQAIIKYNAFDTKKIRTEKVKGKDFFVRGVARRNDRRNIAFACRARNNSVVAMKGQVMKTNGENDDIDPVVAAALIAAVAAIAINN